MNRWSPDYVIPYAKCLRKDNTCSESVQFQTPDDAISIEPTKANPLNPLTKAVYIIGEVELAHSFWIKF